MNRLTTRDTHEFQPPVYDPVQVLRHALTPCRGHRVTFLAGFGRPKGHKLLKKEPAKKRSNRYIGASKGLKMRRSPCQQHPSLYKSSFLACFQRFPIGFWQDGVLSEKEFKRFFECFLRYAFFDAQKAKSPKKAKAEAQQARTMDFPSICYLFRGFW